MCNRARFPNSLSASTLQRVDQCRNAAEALLFGGADMVRITTWLLVVAAAFAGILLTVIAASWLTGHR